MEFILLQAANGNSTYTLIMMVMVFAVLYFFMIRPQAQKAKAQETFSKEVAKGNEVVLNSGIIGKVNKIEGDVIHLQVDQKTYIKVFRTAISKELTESYSKGKVEEVATA